MAKKPASRGRAKTAKKAASKSKRRRVAKSAKKAAPTSRRKPRLSVRRVRISARKSVAPGTPAKVGTELREQWAAGQGPSLMEEYIGSSSGSEHFGS